MSARDFHSYRARYAALTRSRAGDDPELVDAQRLMQEERLVKAIEDALDKAPPMTSQVRQRIVGLLSKGG